jgi:hypothetical protein
MKTKPFAISLAISTTVQTIYIIGISLVSLLLAPSIFQNLNGDPFGGTSPNMLWVTTAIGGLGFILAPIAYAGTGVLYSWLHGREDRPVSAEQGAMGGAATAFTARFIVGIIQAIFTVISTSMMLQTAASQIGPELGGAPETFPLVFGVGIFSGVIGGLIGTCMGSVLAAAMGALGGAISGAMFK